MDHLPNEISGNEILARVICGSGKLRRYVSFQEKSQEAKVKVGVFIDTRNPMELSVNRISTLSLEQAHALGLDHRNEHQTGQTYHGFARLLAMTCFELACKVQKDDYNGTKPYHANIIYPVGQKQDSQEIAVQLAYHAEFVPHSSLS